MRTTEERMTERQFLRILASSVCGIILCLAGLVGTSWAWYSMEIVSTNNEIRVGAFDVSVTVTQESDEMEVLPEEEGYALQPGIYQVRIECLSDNTAPGYCRIRVWDSEEKTAALYPVDPEGAPTVMTFTLDTQPEESWLEITPFLGVPSGENLLTDGSTLTIGEEEAESAEGSDPSEDVPEP